MLARQPTLEYITAYLKHYGGTEHSVTREKQKHVIYIINNPLLLPIKSMCLCPYDMWWPQRQWLHAESAAQCQLDMKSWKRQFEIMGLSILNLALISVLG